VCPADYTVEQPLRHIREVEPTRDALCSVSSSTSPEIPSRKPSKVGPLSATKATIHFWATNTSITVRMARSATSELRMVGSLFSSIGKADPRDEVQLRGQDRPRQISPSIGPSKSRRRNSRHRRALSPATPASAPPEDRGRGQPQQDLLVGICRTKRSGNTRLQSGEKDNPGRISHAGAADVRHPLRSRQRHADALDHLVESQGLGRPAHEDQGPPARYRRRGRKIAVVLHRHWR
jgi:hypothetical protein